MERLSGKVAFITGASQGIGKQIAKKFSLEGAKVCIGDIDQDGGYALAKELGPHTSFAPIDVAEEDDWRAAVEQILESHDRLDILVNNAGVLETGTIEDTDLKTWQRIQAVNAASTFIGCKVAVKTMKNTGGGTIINIASMAAVRPRSSTLAYAASKAAIVNLTKTVASHCAEQNYNIRCNVVLPGAIDTKMIYKNQTADQSDDAFLESVKSRYPMGRMGTPEEIADAVVFLASDESCLMTGAQLRVDGGGSI